MGGAVALSFFFFLRQIEKNVVDEWKKMMGGVGFGGAARRRCLSLTPPPPQVITVGLSRLIKSCNLERSRAVAMMPARASWASAPCLAGSASYCPMYILTVAPAEPVPESRKMIREPSVKTKRRPCLEATLPSTGSV